MSEVTNAGLLTEAEAAAHLKVVTVRQLADMRKIGTGPDYADFGKVVLYREADLDVWFAAQFKAAHTRAAKPAPKAAKRVKKTA